MNRSINIKCKTSLIIGLNTNIIGLSYKKTPLLRDKISFSFDENCTYNWTIQFLLSGIETYLVLEKFHNIYFKKIILELISINYNETIGQNTNNLQFGAIRDIEEYLKPYLEHIYYNGVEKEYFAFEDTPVPTILSIIPTISFFCRNQPLSEIQNEIYKIGTIVSSKNNSISMCCSFLYSWILFNILEENNNFLDADLDKQLEEMISYSIKIEKKLNIATDKLSVLSLLNLIHQEYIKKGSLNIFKINSMIVDFVKGKTMYQIKTCNDYHPLCCVISTIFTFLLYKDQGIIPTLKNVFPEQGCTDIVGTLLGTLFGAYKGEEIYQEGIEIEKLKTVKNVSALLSIFDKFLYFQMKKEKSEEFSNITLEIEEETELAILSPKDSEKIDKNRSTLENKFKDYLISFIENQKDKLVNADKIFEDFFKYYYPKSKVLVSEERKNIFVVIMKEFMQKDKEFLV